MTSTSWATHSHNFHLMEAELEEVNKDIEHSEKRPVSLKLNEETKKEKLHTETSTGTKHEKETKEKKDEDPEELKLCKQLFLFYELIGKLFGITMEMNWNGRKKFFFWVTFFLIILTWFGVLYTQVLHWYNKDYVRFIEPFAVYGMGVSCAMKFFGAIKYHDDMMAMFFVNRQLSYRLPGNRKGILLNGLQRQITILKLYVVGVLLCLLITLIIPLKTFLLKNEFMLIIPTLLPFCDESTAKGYSILTITHLTAGSYAGFAIILYGSSFITVVCAYDYKMKLINEDFKDLDKMWDGENNIPVSYKHSFLRNIIMKRQDVNNYLNFIKKVYDRKLTIHFCFNFFSQIICLFEIRKNDWTPGYSIAIGLFIEMMFYCIMGTIITVSNDQFCCAICDTKWYTYDLHSQRMIKILLHEGQNYKQIELGPLGPLNVLTGIEIVKSIYSYYAILSELL